MKQLSIVILFFVFVCIWSFKATSQIKVLVLSGRNNHEWKKTTPKLKRIYEASGLFEVKVSDKPERLSADDFTNYDVVVSNWNSFPEKDERWPAELEKTLLNFIKEGGGFVTFHASTTCFYAWPEFKTISTGAWIDETKHRENSATHVFIQNTKHAVTKGMQDFFIEDELWINAENNSSFEILGTATNSDLKGRGVENQPVVMVKEFGKGRVFHTTLGHDVRALQNTGFQTLMLRGTEWAASGKVKQNLPQQLRENKEGKFKWAETDTTFALLNGKNVLWQYNFNEFHQKPFFHPINIGRNNITCVSPDDHIWHAGQWFSWKFINGVNYWEYVNRHEYRSEGTTDIRNVKLVRNNDFSAEIILNIVYHPAGGEDVLAETRTIKVSAPQSDGAISMDYSFAFKALAETVELNRSPLESEENGHSWGGYGGLSLRFNQSFMDSYFIAEKGEEAELHGQKNNWLFMGFTGLDGTKVGSQIIIHPETKREEAAWYVTNENNLPFYYYGPAYLYNKSYELLKGEKLLLNYRINHFAGEMEKNELAVAYKKYINQKYHDK